MLRCSCALPLCDAVPDLPITLTVAGSAMGMMLFLMASGLTLIFGLMDVLNFAHGAFITLGAYLAVSVVCASSPDGKTANSWLLNLAAIGAAIARRDGRAAR